MGRDLEAGTPPGYSRLDSSGRHLAGEVGGVAMQVSWVPAAFLSALFCFYLGCSQDCLRRWPFWSSRREVGVATPKRKRGGGLCGDPGLGLTYSVPPPGCQTQGDPLWVLWSLRVFSHSVLSDLLKPLGLLPIRLLCPRNFPGKNTGVGCHFLLQGLFRPRDRTHISCVSCIGRRVLHHSCHLGFPKLASVVPPQASCI